MRRAAAGALLCLIAGWGWAELWPMRYDLPVGKKLVYNTASTTRFDRGQTGIMQSLEYWVVRRNPDSSFHLILRRTQSHYRETRDGRRTETSQTTDWAWCDILPKGGVAINTSLGDIDPGAILVPLPADTFSVRAGWGRYDFDRDERELFRLDNSDLSDSLWIFVITKQTPFDAVYEVTYRGEVQFDTRAGLPVRKDIQNLQGFGGRVTKATTTLGGVLPLDTVWLESFEPELMAMLKAESTASEFARGTGGEDGNAERNFARAESLLLQAHISLTDSSLMQELDRGIDGYRRLKAGSEPTRGGKAKKAIAVGSRAPEWRLTGYDGRRYALKDMRGKVVVLDFWYRGCPWCIRVMPQIRTVAERFRGQPVQILGMSTDRDTNDARLVIERMRLNYPSLRAVGIPEKYGVTGFPTMFVIDQKGTIRSIEIGYAPDAGEKLAKIVEGLLGTE